ncbi:MAG: ribosome maturation factor RimP [Thermoanaerobaculia bacterium]|jgi:ribosome maturation factor RimP
MELPKKIADEIGKIVTAEGLELVHIEYRPQGRGHVLRVDIDKEGGVVLDDLEQMAHQIGAMLDVEDWATTKYDLEVSSPGLDRKFYSAADYQKFVGRLVRVLTKDAVRGLHVVVGRLAAYDGERIVVTDEKMKKDRDYEIAMANIRETRLEIEF